MRFENPEMEVVRFFAEDVITASGGDVNYTPPSPEE